MKNNPFKKAWDDFDRKDWKHVAAMFVIGATFLGLGCVAHNLVIIFASVAVLIVVFMLFMANL